MPKYHGGYKRGQNSPLNAASTKNTTEENVTRHCHDCNRTGTPQWREGPDGPKTLCNACGVKRQRLRRGPRPAAAAAVLDAPRLPSQRLARSTKRTRLSESSEDEQERLSVHDDTGNEDEGEESDQDMAVLNLLSFASSSDVPHKRRRGAGMRSQTLSEAQLLQAGPGNAHVLPTNINPLQAALLQCTSLPQGMVSDPELGILHQMHMTFQSAWVTLSLANTAQAAAEDALRGAEQGADAAREAVALISMQLSHRLSSLAQQAHSVLAQPPPPSAPVTLSPLTNTLNLALPPQPSPEVERVAPPSTTFNFAKPPQPTPPSFAPTTLQLALLKVEPNTNSGNAHHLTHANNGDDDANNHASDNEENGKYAIYHRALNSNAYNGSNLGSSNNNNNNNLNNNVQNNNNLQGLAELMVPLHHHHQQHHHQHHTASTNASGGLHLGSATVRMVTAGHSHDHAAAMDAIAMGVIV